MFSGIYRILVSILGESKQGQYYKTCYQYQFNCMHCADENGGIPDGKYNLEVNLKIGKYKCWKCCDTDGTMGNLSTLIKRYGSRSDYSDFKRELSSIKDSALYDFNLYSGITESVAETFVTLPKTFTKINLSTCKNRRLMDFLSSRKFDQAMIDKYNIGYTTWDEKEISMRNRIIIPSYDEFGDLNYWVGRDFSGYQTKMKYKNCTADKKEIVFQESLVDWDSTVYLVEGAIDCLRLPNSVSLLGKSLKEDSYLYTSIMKRSNGGVVICIDGDTEISETKEIYKKLNQGRLKNQVKYVDLSKMPFKDFSECVEKYGNGLLVKCVKTARKFKDIELL